MRVKTSALKLLAAVAGGVVFTLLAVGFFVGVASTTSSALQDPSTYYSSRGLKLDHKLVCTMRADTGQGPVVGEQYLWLRDGAGFSGKPGYLVAQDKTFTTSVWKPLQYSPTFWRSIERGAGMEMCLDHVSVVDEKRLDRPFCAMELSLSKLELRIKVDDAETLGVCQLLEGPKL